MLKRTRRFCVGGPIWALAVVVFAPAAAEAQQSGLFPLQNIRRERTPHELEDPLYKMYRHEYYGYHPTCWRKFPEKWGCPSPEAPDAKKAFEERRLDIPKPMGDDEEGMPGAPGPDGPVRGGNRPNPGALPTLPPGGSPFDLDKPNAAATPPSDPSGLPGAGDRVPDAPTPTRPVAPPPPGPGDDTNTPPGLSLPDPSAPPAPATVPTVPPTSGDTNSSSTGFQPAKRRGLISQLFNGQLFRR